MNLNVPPGAAKLLDFIGDTETATKVPDAYGVLYANGQKKLKKPITAMTLDEVEASGPAWSKRFGSSAAGRYQFMKNTLDAPGTLKDIEGEMGLTGKELFDPDMQDLMGYHLLKRRGYLQFILGTLPLKTFALNLAKEWASFPVLEETFGQKRKVTRGQSYYAGDGVNKALVAAADVEALLAEVLNETSRPPPKPNRPPIEPDKPKRQSLLGLIIDLIRKLIGKRK